MADVSSSASRRSGRSSPPGLHQSRPQQGRGAATSRSASDAPAGPHDLLRMHEAALLNGGLARDPAAEHSSASSFSSQDARSSVLHVPGDVSGRYRREDVHRREDLHGEETGVSQNTHPTGRRVLRGGRISSPDANAESQTVPEGNCVIRDGRRGNRDRGDVRAEGRLRHTTGNDALNGSRVVNVMELPTTHAGMYTTGNHGRPPPPLSEERRIDAPGFAGRTSIVRTGHPRMMEARDYHPSYPGNERHQWRPTSSQGGDLSAGTVTAEAVEASQQAADEVLEHLSAQRDGGGSSNMTLERHRRRSGQKHSKNHTEPYKQVRAFLPSVVAEQKDKTNTPQLVQELEGKLRKGEVECMICYDMVKRGSAVWSCGGCYAIFHIACIRKWARAPISADLSINASNEAFVGNWRCPGCQSPQFLSAEEIKYRCFCGQVMEPQVDFYLTPHSCGGPCKKSLSSAKSPHCKHVCTMQCHPGPCIPCSALAPPQFCHCGNTSYTQRCSETTSSKSCGQVCGHQLRCGRHFCQKVCHEGPCGSCDTLLTVKCFCNKKVETMACGTMGLQGELDWEHGVFSCESPCLRKLQCGKHACDKKCHPGQCGECELAPGKIQTCPCGKASIQQLLGAGKQRESCTDTVPCCGQICQKLLPCGKHVCQSLCHMGDCPTCEVLVEQKCRCLTSSQTMPCHKALDLDRSSEEVLRNEPAGGLFLCNRKCGKKKSCGRHRCNERCCPLANNDTGLLIGESDPHHCSLPCGKKLRCGQHTCTELCHNGHCPPCMGSTFTELSCACGRTSIPPPVPCGTSPPSCPHPCSRPQPCGHAATHQCHFGECPPCIVLTTKECVGSHLVLRNVPCGSKDIKCNELCGKVRQCQLHACARLCHLPPCEVVSDTGGDKIQSCGQQCGAPRRDCEHVCVAPCHRSASCPETRCKFPVTITCLCGRLSEQVPCDARENSEGNDLLELALISSLSLQPVDAKLKIPLGQRKLACDEDCAKQEKKRVLADAFSMTGVPADPALSAACVQTASEALKELITRDPQWVLAVEDRFKYLVLGAKPVSAPVRVHVFGFLPKEQREAVWQVAKRWNLTVSAVGREPKRFLTVHVNSKSRAPQTRMLFGRSVVPLPGQAQAPAYSPSLDMDPRLVVALFELPREGDISALVLRFGGECELVWLNDKNALAVFSDEARAAAAIRRVDHASAYSGAVSKTAYAAGTTTSSVQGWGSNEAAATSKSLPHKKKSVQGSSWSDDAWGEEWGRSVQAKTAWDRKGPAIAPSINPWGALEEVEAAAGNNPTKGLEKPSSSSAPRAVATLNCPASSGEADSWEDLVGC